MRFEAARESTYFELIQRHFRKFMYIIRTQGCLTVFVLRLLKMLEPFPTTYVTLRPDM
jgi:hypothetical protein